MLSRHLTRPARLDRYRSVLRTTSVSAGAALVAFHGWLFAGQIADGSLADPWLVFRWAAAAGLVAALALVRRNGESVGSRKGVAIWVLAALLHGPAVGASTTAFDQLALPETVATSVLQLITSTAVGLGLWLLAALLVRRERHAHRLVAPALAFSAAGILADGFSPPYASRPPPQNS